MIQKYLLLLALSALFFSCNGENQPKKDSVARPAIKEIKGIWNLKSRDCAKINPKGISEAPTPRERFNTIVVEDSTISFFRYPYEFIFSYTYQRNADELMLKDFPHPYTFQIKDSMLIVTETQQKGDCLTQIEKYGRSRGTYNQDTVNPPLLETLKKDTLNFSMLTGKWRLSTERGLNDGSDPVPLKFPFKIPHKLTFPDSRMDTLVSKQIIYLDVNGKKRPFLISIDDENSFWISAWQWKLAGPEMIYYRMDE